MSARRDDVGEGGEAFDEVTLADLLGVLVRRKRLVVGTFVAVLLVTVVVTAATEKRYEASATILPASEHEKIVAVLNSERFASSVAVAMGVVEPLDGANGTLAGRALAGRVTATLGSGRIGDTDRSIITITAAANTAAGAAELAQAYVDTLDDWRVVLADATWDKNWQAYYEAAGKDEALARQQLSDLVSGFVYYEELDTAVPPSGPVSPSWRLNLVLGLVLGIMTALFLPFVVEAATNALRTAWVGARTDPQGESPSSGARAPSREIEH